MLASYPRSFLYCAPRHVPNTLLNRNMQPLFQSFTLESHNSHRRMRSTLRVTIPSALLQLCYTLRVTTLSVHTPQCCFACPHCRSPPFARLPVPPGTRLHIAAQTPPQLTVSVPNHLPVIFLTLGTVTSQFVSPFWTPGGDLSRVDTRPYNCVTSTSPLTPASS